MSHRLDEICTMCDAPIDKYEANGAVCKKCGTKFENDSNFVLDCEPLFVEGEIDSPLTNNHRTFESVKTDVPESVFKQFYNLDKEEKDEQIYTLARAVVKKYSNDASAYLEAAMVLSNALIRKVRKTNLDEIKLNSKKEYQGFDNDYNEIIDFFKKAEELFQEEENKNWVVIYKGRFEYMYEFALFDNVIDTMSTYVKSRDAEDLLYGIETNVMTEDELKTLNYIENKEEIEKRAKKEVKKKHFFSKNIFASLGLLVCLVIIVCAIIYPYVPIARYLISGEFYDWVGVGIAALIVLARIIYVVKENRDAVLLYKYKMVYEPDSIVESKNKLEPKSEAEPENDNPEKFKSLIDTANKIREEKGEDDYWNHTLDSIVNKYLHLPKEEFMCRSYAELVIIMRMIETDTKNSKPLSDDVYGLGTIYLEDYCIIKEMGENIIAYRKMVNDKKENQ